MKRMYTVMESSIGETKTKIEQAASATTEIIDHKNNSTIHVTANEKAAWNKSIQNIGPLEDLHTQNQGSLIDAVNELFTSANNGKTAVANAVTAKGVSASPTDTFSVLATKIGQINTGKRFASGELQAIRDINITGLGFRPSVVFLRQGNTSSNPWTTVPWIYQVYNPDFGINIGFYRGSTSGSDWPTNETITTTESGFYITLPTVDSAVAKPHKWIAIE